jgi:hypothetical protein
VNTLTGTGSGTDQQLTSGMIRFRSQAFEEISRLMIKNPGFNILELGMPLGMNVEYFSNYSCRLFIENLYTCINQTPVTKIPTELVSMKYAGLEAGEKLDLVLCWDLFDYLKSAQIMSVVDLFRCHIQRGTLLYVLTSDTRMIADQPQCYRLATDNYIEPELPTLQQRENPRHRPAVLQEWLGSFNLYRSFMLSNGRLEHLFQAA